MKITFYLQYFSYNDENFKVDDNYYQDSNDYIRQLEESYNQTKDAIFDAMSKGNLLEKNTYKMPITNQKENKTKYSYAKCDGILIDESMEEINSKSIDALSVIQDVFVTMMKLDTPIEDEDFELNWKMFLDSSLKIMNYDTDEDWKFIHKPTKDIYFSYEDKNSIKYGKLVNCRLIESSDLYNNVLLIEKMEKINKLG